MAINNPNPTARSAESMERVCRLARPYGLLANGARHLAGATGENLLVSLLVELDETILPRHFTVETDTGHSVGLHVVGRRLLRIDPAIGETQPTKAAEVLVQLQQVFDGATKASLWSRRAERADTNAFAGVAITTIIAVGELFQTTPAAHDPVPNLFNALSGRISAWLMLDSPGNKVQDGGDVALVHRLDTLVREGLDDIEIQMTHSLTDPQDPGCIMLSSQGFNGLTLLYARSDHTRLVALFASSELSCVLPAWKAFYHCD